MENSKRIHLTQKEITRADKVKSFWGEHQCAIISRPQHGGGYMVAAVSVETGMIMADFLCEWAPTKAEVPAAVRSVNRWLSKTGFGSQMADSSRVRPA